MASTITASCKPSHDLLYWNGKTFARLTPEQIQGILKRARSGELWLSTPDVPEHNALRALVLAINPETSNSLLYIATKFTGERLQPRVYF